MKWRFGGKGVDDAVYSGHLTRLDRAYYMGRTAIHWSFAMEERAKAWLNPLMHARFRECLLHAGVRYQLACPIYCLMPDHMHLLLVGLGEDSDQLNGIKFLRRHLNTALEEHRAELQKQAHDHVLTEKERERNAFQAVAWYIAENPVRAGLVKEAREWQYTACCSGSSSVERLSSGLLGVLLAGAREGGWMVADSFL